MRNGTESRAWIARETVEPSDSISSDSAQPSSECPSEARSLRDMLPTCRFLSTDDLTFSAIANDHSEAKQGDLVVYRIGKDCPSRLVADAAARGAAGILTEQVLPCPIPQCIVGDVDLALAQIASNLQGRPDRQLLTIGVVGSAGKTSTTLLIASLLRSAGIRTAFQSDLGESDGIVQTTPTEAVPCGSALIDWLTETVDSQCGASVIELSEEKARHGHYDSMEFDLLVVTGSASCSGDFGPTGIQCILDRLTAEGVVIAASDDQRTMQCVRESGVQSMTYGVRRAADVTAKIIDQSGGMTTLLVTHRDTTAVMETPLCGAGMAANHAAAAVVGLLLEIPIHESVERLGQLRSIPGRGQRLSESGKATVVLETGGSSDRIATALRTFRSMKERGRLWCVLAIDAATKPEQLADFGSLVERFADVGIVTSTPESKPKFLSLSHHVLDGVKQCAAFRLVGDQRRAIEWCVGGAGPQDTVVLITNQSADTPHDHRRDLERLEKIVDQARSDSHEGETPATHHGLKIFG